MAIHIPRIEDSTSELPSATFSSPLVDTLTTTESTSGRVAGPFMGKVCGEGIDSQLAFKGRNGLVAGGLEVFQIDPQSRGSQPKNALQGPISNVETRTHLAQYSNMDTKEDLHLPPDSSHVEKMATGEYPQSPVHLKMPVEEGRDHPLVRITMVALGGEGEPIRAIVLTKLSRIGL